MTVREFNRSLLIVDPSVFDYSALLAGATNASVLILDSSRDGVEQITQALSEHSALGTKLQSLQILSHGQAGAVRLGNAELSLQSLSRYAADLTAWAKALAGAEVWLYGCEVAAGRLGRQFLQGLKALIGSELAASATPTGSSALGGDWNLEVTTGPIVAPMVLAAQARAAYAHSLPTLVDDTFREATVADPNWRIGVGPVSNPSSPPQEPFLTASSSPTGVIPGSPTGAIDAPGDGALRLTNSVLDQASFVLYDRPIDSRQGLTVTFELYAYGGTGADGLSFFLLDGAVSPQDAGAFGGSLGYAQKNGIAPGLTGGYLGVGFDEFGNYSSATDFPGGPIVRTGGPGQTPDSIAIRAGESTGYQFVPGTVTTLPFGIDTPTATTREAAKRTVKVDLTPTGLLSVRIDGNNDGDFLDPGETSPNLININVAGVNGTAPPTTLKFGFASGTGDFTNIHEVRNLVVSTLNQEPTAIDFAGAIVPGTSNLLQGFSATDPDIPDGDSIDSFTIVTLPPADQGTLFLGDPALGGQPIAAGATLTPVQIQTVFFQAAPGFTGGTFTYTATDSRGSSDSTPATVSLSVQPTTPQPPIPPLPPPTGDNRAPNTDPSSLRLPQNTVARVPGLSGSDPDSGDTVEGFSIRTLPPASQGVLYLGNPTQGGTPITIGQVLTPAQIQQVFFQSSTGFSGSQFSYAAIDSRGAGDQTPAIVALELDSGVLPGGCLPGKDKEGTRGDNRLKGGPNIDTLVGKGGNDQLKGLGCNDVLEGGRGNDRLFGGGDRDRLLGQQGKDRLSGNGGDDVLNLGLGRDQGFGNKGRDILFGRRGNDRLAGNGGNDELSGGRGKDRILGGTNQDFLDGQQGNDRLQGGKGRDVINGGLGFDRIRGDQRADRVTARRGNDVVRGGGGRDLLLGQRGNDRLIGNTQADRLRGGFGDDVLIGSAGSDRIRTGKGADRIVYRSAEHGLDTIVDFDLAVDRIDLRQVFDQSDYGQANRFDAYVRLAQGAEGAVLRVDSNGDVADGFLRLAVLQGITSSSLSTGNFLV